MTDNNSNSAAAAYSTTARAQIVSKLMPDSPWDFEDVDELVGILLSPVGAEVAEALKSQETRKLLCSPNGRKTFFELAKDLKKQKKSEPEPESESEDSSNSEDEDSLNSEEEEEAWPASTVLQLGVIEATDDAKEVVSDPLENKFINSKLCFLMDVPGCLKMMAEDPFRSLIAVQGMGMLTIGLNTSALAITAALKQHVLCTQSSQQRKSKVAQKHQEMVSALRFIPFFRPQLHNLTHGDLPLLHSSKPI
jgi:hypothetical protein